MAAGVTIDKTDLFSVEKSMEAIRKGVPDAIRFATNNALSGLKTDASKEIRKHVTAKAKYVDRDITIKKMYVSDLSAHIEAKGEPLPLVAYKHSQIMKGVKVQVKQEGSPKLVKHAFVATMKSGHKGIFWREKRQKGKYSKRWPEGKYATAPPTPKKRTPYQIAIGYTTFQLPLTERYGPRVPDVFKQDAVMKPMLEKASDKFDERLEYHTDRLMDKARAA
jgi:hypothetical protein